MREVSKALSSPFPQSQHKLKQGLLKLAFKNITCIIKAKIVGNLKWVVPENIHTHTMGAIQRGEGLTQTRTLDLGGGGGEGSLDWNSKGMGGGGVRRLSSSLVLLSRFSKLIGNDLSKDND